MCSSQDKFEIPSLVMYWLPYIGATVLVYLWMLLVGMSFLYAPCLPFL